MPSPAFTPGEGGGKPAKPESENVWEFPWLVPQPPPEPEPEVTSVTPMINLVPPNPLPTAPVQQPQPESTSESTQSSQSFRLGEQILRRNRERARQDAAPQSGERSNVDNSRAELIPDIDEIKFQYFAGAQEITSDPVYMDYYLAARHNALLHEVQLICQHEGIPPALRGHPDWVLSLCAEYGIDEENHAEARAYVEHWTQTLLGSDYRHQSTYNPLLRANELWIEAHAAYDPNVSEKKNNSNPAIENYRVHIETTFGVSLTRAIGVSPNTDEEADFWDLLRLRMVHVGLEMAAAALGDMARSIGYHWDDATAFRRIIGDVELFLSNETSSRGALAKVGGRKITIFWSTAKDRNYYPIPNLLLHELGHVFNANAGMGNRNRFGSINAATGHPNTLTGMGSPYPTKLLTDDRNKLVIHSSSLELVNPLHDDLGLEKHDKLFDNAMLFSQDQVQLLQQSWEYTKNEFTADAFLNWVYHRNTMGVFGFTDTAEGEKWQKFVNDNMEAWIQNAIGYNAWRRGVVSSLAEEGLISPIAGTGTVGNFDPGDKSFRVRPTPSLDEDPLTTLSRGEEVLVLGESEPDGDGKRWIAVWVNGVHWIREDLINVTWSDQRPEKPMTEEESEQWFPTLMMLLAGR